MIDVSSDGSNAFRPDPARDQRAGGPVRANCRGRGAHKGAIRRAPLWSEFFNWPDLAAGGRRNE